MSLSETAARTARPHAHHVPAGDPAPDVPVFGPKQTLAAIAFLVFDTFRQAAASRLILLALGLTGLGVLTCLSVRVQGARTLQIPGEIELTDAQRRPLTGSNATLGRMTIGFGVASVGNFRDVESQVRFLQVILARWAVGVAGTLLLLASTAGFLPEFLRPGSSSILLAKPVPRWALLTGKVVGVIAFVAALTGGFIAGTWLALGVRTGVWSPGYLAAWPLVVAQFAGLYSASVVAATCTRNTAASLFAALACWMICLGVNDARETIQAPSGAPSHPPVTRIAVEAAYWVLPKPLDMSRMLDRAVGASDHFTVQADSKADVTGREIAALLGSSLAFAAVMLAVAGRQLSTTDY